MDSLKKLTEHKWIVVGAVLVVVLAIALSVVLFLNREPKLTTTSNYYPHDAAAELKKIDTSDINSCGSIGGASVEPGSIATSDFDNGIVSCFYSAYKAHDGVALAIEDTGVDTGTIYVLISRNGDLKVHEIGFVNTNARSVTLNCGSVKLTSDTFSFKCEKAHGFGGVTTFHRGFSND